MKVTFCAYDRENYINGPNVWLQRLLPELKAQNCQVKVLFLLAGRQAGCFPTLSWLQQAGIECSYTVLPTYAEQRVRWILEELRRDPPDVFVPNVVVAAYHAAGWIQKAGIPTVGVLHSVDAFHQALVKEFTTGAVYTDRRLSALVVVSQYLEHYLHQQTLPDTQVWQIPSIVPIPQGKAAAEENRFGLVYSGRLVEEAKRVSEVTRAFCQAAREVRGVTGVLYGDGPSRATVEHILHNEGAGLSVRLGGLVANDQIQERMLENHAIVLLSDYEGLPISLLEGMACGLVPVCLRTRSGIPELVEHNVTGLLVEDRGASFVAAIRRLREEPGLWVRLSQAARARVTQQYAPQIVTGRWLDMVQTLQQSATPVQTVVLPQRIKLPPVHPALAHEDLRTPPVYKMPRIYLWHLVARLKRMF